MLCELAVAQELLATVDFCQALALDQLLELGSVWVVAGSFKHEDVEACPLSVGLLLEGQSEMLLATADRLKQFEHFLFGHTILVSDVSEVLVQSHASAIFVVLSEDLPGVGSVDALATLEKIFSYVISLVFQVNGYDF